MLSLLSSHAGTSGSCSMRLAVPVSRRPSPPAGRPRPSATSSGGRRGPGRLTPRRSAYRSVPPWFRQGVSPAAARRRGSTWASGLAHADDPHPLHERASSGGGPVVLPRRATDTTNGVIDGIRGRGADPRVAGDPPPSGAGRRAAASGLRPRGDERPQGAPVPRTRCTAHVLRRDDASC